MGAGERGKLDKVNKVPTCSVVGVGGEVRPSELSSPKRLLDLTMTSESRSLSAMILQYQDLFGITHYLAPGKTRVCSILTPALAKV